MTDEMKFSLQRITQLKNIRNKILNEEQERKKLFKLKQESLRKEFFEFVFEEFSRQVQSKKNNFEFWRLTDNNSSVLKVELNLGKSSVKVTSSEKKVSIIIDNTEVYKYIAKCCYYLNFSFVFNYQVVGSLSTFTFDRTRDFATSMWNFSPIEIVNGTVKTTKRIFSFENSVSNIIFVTECN